MRIDEGGKHRHAFCVLRDENPDFLTEPSEATLAFVWSPDGKQIACSEFYELWVERLSPTKHFIIDLDTKQRRPLNLPSDHVLTDWSPDGKSFLTTQIIGLNQAAPANRTARLYLTNVEGTESKALNDANHFRVAGRFSPDGKRVLYRRLNVPINWQEDRFTLEILDPETGQSMPLADMPPNGSVYSQCWSPDGKRIAYTWQLPEGSQPKNKPAECHLVICDSDGKNGRTISVDSRQERPQPEQVDWR